VNNFHATTDFPLQSFDKQLSLFPGSLLRQAREEKGLSQQQIAHELCLTLSVLNGLEDDDFSLMQNAVFARGYIRSYARHVGLDADAMVAKYDAVYGSPDNNKELVPGLSQSIERDYLGDAWVKLTSILLGIVLLGASWWWWQNQNQNTAPTVMNKVAVQDSQGVDLLATLPISAELDMQWNQEASTNTTKSTTYRTELMYSIPDEKPTQEPVSIAPLTKVEAATSPLLPTQPDLTPLSEDAGLLRMVFLDDCWVEIKDGDGKIVITGLKKKGGLVESMVKAPVQVLLGRASAVKMAFSGRTIDLVPHTRRDIARVTLQ
jgi:cytoskeleton protein RodZ